MQVSFNVYCDKYNKNSMIPLMLKKQIHTHLCVYIYVEQKYKLIK